MKAVFIGIFLLFIPSPAMASGSLALQPLRQELELKPGQTVNSKVLVTNTTDKPQIIKMSASTFNVTNENYDYSFNETEQTAKWVTFAEPSAQVAPRTSHTFNYTIGVPNNAEPGERDLAVFASVNLPSGDVDVVNRVGELTYLTVAGNITRHGKVLSLSFPIFSIKPTLRWQTRLQATGTAHYKSILTVTTTNLFNRSISKSSDEHLLLPNAPRLLQGKTKVGRWPGIYKVHFNIGQGDDPAHKQTKWVLYFPVWAMIALAVAIIFLLPEVLKIRRKRRTKHYY